LRQQGLRYVLGAGGCRIGDDPAAVLVEIDVRHGELALGQNGRKRVARGLGQIALLAAARLHLGRIDPAQPHLGGDVEAGPQVHARLERVAVEHAQHLGRISAFGSGPDRRLRSAGKLAFRRPYRPARCDHRHHHGAADESDRERAEDHQSSRSHGI